MLMQSVDKTGNRAVVGIDSDYTSIPRRWGEFISRRNYPDVPAMQSSQALEIAGHLENEDES